MPTMEYIATLGEDEIELPLLISYEQTAKAIKGDRVDPPSSPEYDWHDVQIETEKKVDGTIVKGWVSIKESPSIQEYLEAEFANDRLFDAMHLDFLEYMLERRYEEAREDAA